jgi:hypothetical protein
MLPKTALVYLLTSRSLHSNGSSHYNILSIFENIFAQENTVTKDKESNKILEEIYNEELNNFYSFSHTFKVIKLRTISWAEYIKRSVKIKDECTYLL